MCIRDRFRMPGTAKGGQALDRRQLIAAQKTFGLYGQRGVGGAGSFSKDRPLGWDPVAAGNRAGDGMARFVSEEKAPGTPSSFPFQRCHLICERVGAFQFAQSLSLIHIL